MILNYRLLKTILFYVSFFSFLGCAKSQSIPVVHEPVNIPIVRLSTEPLLTLTSIHRPINSDRKLVKYKTYEKISKSTLRDTTFILYPLTKFLNLSSVEEVKKYFVNFEMIDTVNVARFVTDRITTLRYYSSLQFKYKQKKYAIVRLRFLDSRQFQDETPFKIIMEKEIEGNWQFHTFSDKENPIKFIRDQELKQILSTLMDMNMKNLHNVISSYKHGNPFIKIRDTTKEENELSSYLNGIFRNNSGVSNLRRMLLKINHWRKNGENTTFLSFLFKEEE